MNNRKRDTIVITKDTDLAAVCVASDQRAEPHPGDRTWGIIYQPGGQRGQMSHYVRYGRGAIAFGGDSMWGDWIQGRLHTNDGFVYDDHGNLVII